MPHPSFQSPKQNESLSLYNLNCVGVCEKRKENRTCGGETTRKRPLGRHKHRWEDNMKLA